jgi:Lon protease-like protein
LPTERRRLLPLLRRIVADLGPERIAEPHRFDEAEWVGYRITEVLPIQNLAKQKLLELDDPLARLEILETFLDQRKLLG